MHIHVVSCGWCVYSAYIVAANDKHQGSHTIHFSCPVVSAARPPCEHYASLLQATPALWQASCPGSMPQHWILVLGLRAGKSRRKTSWLFSYYGIGHGCRIALPVSIPLAKASRRSRDLIKILGCFGRVILIVSTCMVWGRRPWLTVEPNAPSEVVLLGDQAVLRRQQECQMSSGASTMTGRQGLGIRTKLTSGFQSLI